MVEQAQLPVARKLSERPVELDLAVLVDLANRDAIDLLRRKSRLVALLRRALQPGAAAILTAVDAPGAGQCTVDIDHHTRIASPWAQLIGGNQMLDGCFEKANLGLQQIEIGSSDRVVAQIHLLSSPKVERHPLPDLARLATRGLIARRSGGKRGERAEREPLGVEVESPSVSARSRVQRNADLTSCASSR